MAEDNNVAQLPVSEVASPSLLREMQYSLYEIARAAEVEDSAHIQKQAEGLMRLVDSYQTAAQLEIGQLALELSPCGLGSVMHEVAHELYAAFDMSVTLQAGVHAPAMTQPKLLTDVMFHAGSMLGAFSKKPLKLISFSVSETQLGLGIFAKDVELKQAELEQALSRENTSHMPLATHSERSVIALRLAADLTQAIGGKFIVGRRGGYRGFMAVVPKSEQLSLVST